MDIDKNFRYIFKVDKNKIFCDVTTIHNTRHGFRLFYNSDYITSWLNNYVVQIICIV